MPDIIQDQPAIDILPTDQGGVSKEFTTPEPEDQSLASHIEDFHAPAEDPKPIEAKTDAKPDQLKPRHRAAKDRARPEDVPRIRELTAKIKDLEAKYEAATKQPPAAAPQPNPIPPAPQVGAKPTWGTFEAEIGTTYKTWGEAQDAYADARDAWKSASQQVEQHQQAVTQQQQEAEQAVEQQIIAKGSRYQEQVNAYVQQHPDRQATFQNIPNVPPLMLETIWGMESAPDVVYTLLNTPGMFQEMHLLTDGKPISQQNVATATKWLHSRVQTGSTPSVARASQSQPLAPRPPNGVRTTPMPPPSAPPGDSGSLLEHNAYFKTAR